ncbi:MAG: Holliday junction resolvase RuvX [Holosporaceae bacterium]|jgi:putative Holliday junction resolvase|nr:Holliday junction resolvase RuvX [Holosporaceae bacterium]
MENFFLKNLGDLDIGELIRANSVVVGLDVGDKTIGISVSDQRIRIATGVRVIGRSGMAEKDSQLLAKYLSSYKVGLIILGWPVQMNGLPGEQCMKVLDFMKKLLIFFPVNYAKWDERFSTKVVDKIMIQAGLSRKKREKLIDKTAAAYILQGALDFFNKNSLSTNNLDS